MDEIVVRKGYYTALLTNQQIGEFLIRLALVIIGLTTPT